MIRLRNLSLLALVRPLRGKNRKRVCVLALLLGLCFIGRSFAGTSNFDNIGLQSDSIIGLSYIAMFESIDETDTDYTGEAAPDGSFSRTATRTVVGWIIIRYNPVTGYWELCWMTPGAFNTVAGYNQAYLDGYEGLDIFRAKQQIYNPITGEIYVPIEKQSPVNLQ